MKDLGTDFIKTESERVKKLKEGRLTAAKKESMDMRLNILASFKNAAAAAENGIGSPNFWIGGRTTK